MKSSTHIVKYLSGSAAICSLFFYSCRQPPPEIEWQQVFGGIENERLITVLETPDGGYLLGGLSGSGISGDRTDFNRGIWEDYWIVKTDAGGNKEWDKAFGGSYFDHFSQMKSVIDGGYILVGVSQSPAGGDKSESNLGKSDGWVVKLDAAFNKQWDRTFGTSDDEALYGLQPLFDGNIVFAGSQTIEQADSINQHNSKNHDFWVLVADKTGNELRSANFGGNLADMCLLVEASSNNGFLLAGMSESNVSGDITKPCWGKHDYWIVRTDTSLEKHWDERFGGSGTDLIRQICPVKDGGFLLGGYSDSEPGFEKSQASRGGFDYWIVCIDSTGKKLWDKTYGGYGDDLLTTIAATRDGGYVIGGASNSGISGDKTSVTFAGYDIWIVKTDANGNQLWDLTLGGYGNDGGYVENGATLCLLQTKDGGYIVGAYSDSGINGIKTKPGRGGGDYWLIKLKPEKSNKWFWW